MYEYYLCSDSADLYGWLLRNADIEFCRNTDLSRSIFLTLSDTKVKITFIHKQSNKSTYDDKVKHFLSETAGTPDYVLFQKDSKIPIICIEDSKTAPVGNAVVQRLDKLWPLIVSNKITCPVVYVGPKEGLDESQQKLRSWTQSWFYKSFAKNFPDIFVLLEQGESVCQRVFELLSNAIEKNINGENVQKTKMLKEDLEKLHEAMIKSIRTYSDDSFHGKIFQPKGTDAHPIQSTLMFITEVRKALKLNKLNLFLSESHIEKFNKSKARRLLRVKTNGVNVCEK
jgi:hypothetical protein